jgi:acylphosphatase
MACSARFTVFERRQRGHTVTEPAVRVHVYIRGRVQGVGFRWFVEREAHRAWVSGFVRNLPDGRVEVVAEGPKNVLEAFLSTLRRGPAGAEVHELTAQWDAPTGLSGFRIQG